MIKSLVKDFVDESVPVHPDAPERSPLVVYGDHGLCSGVSNRVQRMARPHMHSQIEINYVLEGSMTYRVDGRDIHIAARKFTMFWGMIPHQVVEHQDPTLFVCLYAPMSVFLGLSQLSRLREAIFRGAVVEATQMRDSDHDMLANWHQDLMSGDKALIEIVRDELTSRIRRIDRDGWQDLRDQAPVLPHFARHDGDGILNVEKMARFIGEHAHEDISVEDVGKASGLHPNYAMSLFKRMTGMTILQSITRHRLDIAQSMLIGTDRPAAHIAFECGFGSLSTFYEAFERRFGTSPVAYRKGLAGVTA